MAHSRAVEPTHRRTLLIAGYEEGLGYALKSHFVGAGYQVIGLARGPQADLRVDLLDPVAVDAAIEAVKSTGADVVGVIHTAMKFHRGGFIETEPATFEEVWRSMVMTAVGITKAVLPSLQQRGGGVLLYTGASGSTRAGAGFAAFSSAKFALRGLVQSVSREFSQIGVRATHVVVDGLIRTARTKERFPSYDVAKMIDPVDLAEQYFNLFHQSPRAWTQEVEIRSASAAF